MTMNKFVGEYDGMTDRDIENLNFLLNSSKATIQEWMTVVDSDDLDYALLLMSLYHLRLCDLAVERSDLSDAKEILEKVSK
jgi:hypothetical protein